MRYENGRGIGIRGRHVRGWPGLAWPSWAAGASELREGPASMDHVVY